MTLDVSQYEYDDEHLIHSKRKCIDTIYNALSKYGILPNASEYDGSGDAPIFMPINVISDGAYLAKKDENRDVYVDSEFKSTFDLVPWFLGWSKDPPHEIENAKKRINKRSRQYGKFINLLKCGSKPLLNAKWKIMAKNIAKKYNLNFKKLKKLCLTRFMAHYSKTINILLFDMETIYTLFDSMTDPTNGKIAKTCKSWHDQWKSKQFLFMLMVQDDVQWAFDILIKCSQKSHNTCPGYRHFYYIKSETALNKIIQGLKFLVQVFTAYKRNQFVMEYDLVNDLEKESICFENVFNHVFDIMLGEYADFQLSSNNIFSNYSSKRQEPIIELNDQEYNEIYGIQTDDEESTDDERDSDYEPEIKSDMSDYDELMEKVHTERQSRKQNKKDGIGRFYLYGCNEYHDPHELQCSCGGVTCIECIHNKFEIDLSESDLQRMTMFCCENCLDLIIDVLYINLDWINAFVLDFYCQENKIKWGEKYADIYFYGLSLNRIVELFLKYELEYNVIKTKLLHRNFINDGFEKFLEFYRKCGSDCRDTVYEELFYLSTNNLKELYVKLKRDMVSHTLEIYTNYTDEDGDISPKQYECLINDLYVHFNKKINTAPMYTEISLIWNIGCAQLQTESIAESINSILRRMYTFSKQSFLPKKIKDLLITRTALPEDEPSRNIVVKEVFDEYEQQHNSKHHTSRTTKWRRSKKNIDVDSNVLIKQKQGKYNKIWTLPFI